MLYAMLRCYTSSLYCILWLREYQINFNKSSAEPFPYKEQFNWYILCNSTYLCNNHGPVENGHALHAHGGGAKASPPLLTERLFLLRCKYMLILATLNNSLQSELGISKAPGSTPGATGEPGGTTGESGGGMKSPTIGPVASLISGATDFKRAAACRALIRACFRMCCVSAWILSRRSTGFWFGVAQATALDDDSSRASSCCWKTTNN